MSEYRKHTLKNGRELEVRVVVTTSRFYLTVDCPEFDGWEYTRITSRHRNQKAMEASLQEIIDDLNAQIDERAALMDRGLNAFRDPTPLTLALIQKHFTLRPGSQAFWELHGEKFAICCSPEMTDELGADPLWRTWPEGCGPMWASALPTWLRPTTVGHLRHLCWRLNISLPEKLD